MTRGRARPGQGGFSLLEVLVAFAVLTVTLGVLLNIFSLAIRTTQSALEQQKAMLLAESKLTELDAGSRLRPGREQGWFDDHYWWETRVEEFDLRGLMENDSMLMPYRMEVVVGWGRDQQYRLSTLRLVRLEAR
ncbi:general secretion pathway protein GspH [Zobellella denitrificans]|uniref:General secretion pathway protein GspH n=1 Tax=Zobellella denitrificans TaxID=347534 RepID=A0A231N186_9GAMM|nr:prepilin-type N-terminal cleavage/methylation domain-containing protein [Zobellella denitrificans]ATG75695.1 general secretion pathway protein GspH [Zobellella denitrificans]OXS15975.1 general secretion pathway protein GspH [Zobellella denitrificans]